MPRQRRTAAIGVVVSIAQAWKEEMASAARQRLRRWPFGSGVVVLGLLDLFAVLVLIEGVGDTEDTGNRTLGIVLVGGIIALLTWLTSSLGKGAVAAVGCVSIGTLGLSIARTPSATARAQALGAMNRATQERAATGQWSEPIVGWADDPQSMRPVTTPSWVRLPIDRTVSYRESMSEVPWLLLCCGVAASAGLIGGIVQVGTRWPVVLLALPLGALAIWIITCGLFAPYGIRLSGGVLRLGVLGWPAIGQIWRRQDIPLEEVLAWTVCPRARTKTGFPRSPFPDGDIRLAPIGNRGRNWGNFTEPGVRTVLVVRVDPARVPAAMPDLVMVSYGVQNVSDAAEDIGVYVIGTHRAQRLARTLDKVMPSRRSLA